MLNFKYKNTKNNDNNNNYIIYKNKDNFFLKIININICF